jgi:hypothetical protein
MSMCVGANRLLDLSRLIDVALSLNNSALMVEQIVADKQMCRRMETLEYRST